MKLRDYQAEDVELILEELKSFQSTLYLAGTGLGKTVVASELIIRTLPSRAIILAHRNELVWQARKTLMQRGVSVDVEKGELVSSKSLFNQSQVVVATVQTMTCGKELYKRMHSFDPKHFGLLILDEAHHYISPSYRKVVDYFTSGNPNLKVCGITATGDRQDEKGMGAIFQSIAAERDILFGVENGWLVEPRQKMVHLGSLDFSHIKTTAGDLNLGELAAVMEAEECVAGVAQPTLEAMFGLDENALGAIDPGMWGEFLMAQCEPRRTIVFTVSVAQAEMLSNIFNRVVPGISKWLCGKTPDEQRENIFSAFGSGAASVLVNCGVTTEGYDNPAVELIVIARPTKSRSLYAQMIGRGTRPLPGVVDDGATRAQRLMKIALSAKTHMTVLDLVGNSGKHKLITTADVLGGRVSDEAIERAAKKAKAKGEEVSMKKLLEEEELALIKERELKKQQEEARKARLVAKVHYSSTEVNPFNAFDLSPAKPRAWDNGKQLSPAQTELLLKQRIDPSRLTYSQGRQLIQELFKRWRNKDASLRQCAKLKQHGYQTKGLTYEAASKLLDGLSKNKWRRPDFDGVAEGLK